MPDGVLNDGVHDALRLQRRERLGFTQQRCIRDDIVRGVVHVKREIALEVYEVTLRARVLLPVHTLHERTELQLVAHDRACNPRSIRAGFPA